METKPEKDNPVSRNNTEIESKFLITDKDYREIMDIGKIGKYGLRGTGIKKINDKYYDTPDRLLVSCNGEYRIRKLINGNNKTFLNYKIRKGIIQDSNVYEEYECEVSTDNFFKLHEESTDLLPVIKSREFFKDSDLIKTLEVDIERAHLTYIKDKEIDSNSSLVYLDLDKICYNNGSRPIFENELEIEYNSGNLETYLDFVQELKAMFDLKPVILGKYERGIMYYDS